jgi:excisionase family DNA binding protein
MTFEDLERLIAQAPTEDLPRLIGDLEAAKAQAWARLAMPKFLAANAAAGEDHLLSMPEVAIRLGIKEHQAREMGRRGELPLVKVGERFVRVREAALADWIKARERGTLLRDRR